MPNGMFGGPDEIVPGVYLGGFLALDACQRTGIEYVLSIVDMSSYDQIKEEILNNLLEKEDVKLDLFHVDLEDKPASNLLEHLDKTTAYIEKVLQANGKVLIHCMAGVSRSATCVAAHLVKNEGMSPQDAIKLMKEKRECVNPNAGFMKQLRAWHAMSNKVDKEHQEYLKLFPAKPNTPNSNGKSQFEIEREVPIVSLPDHNLKNAHRQATAGASPAEQEAASTSSVTAVTESVMHPSASSPSASAPRQPPPVPQQHEQQQKPAPSLGCFACFK